MNPYGDPQDSTLPMQLAAGATAQLLYSFEAVRDGLKEHGFTHAYGTAGASTARGNSARLRVT